MKTRIGPRRTVGALLFGLLLTACGGGGGGGGAPAGVQVPTGARAGAASAGSDVTAANANSFAGPLARLLMGAADGTVPVVASGGSPPLRAAGAALSGSVKRFALAAARERALATTTQTLACPFGGTMTVTANDADNNTKLSAGDSASIQFNACVAEAGLPAASGSLTFVVNAIELDANGGPTALDASFTLAGFTELGFGSISGTFRVWFKNESPTSTRQRLSYQSATVIEEGQPLRYDFDTYGVSGSSGGSFEMSGALVIGGQTYALTSTLLSHGAGTPPSAGALTLRDAAGDAVILRARSATTFDLEFQPNGAATPTVLATGLVWASYRLGSS